MPGFDGTKKNLSSFNYAIAGAVSGSLTRFLTQPLDVIKIRFQLQVEPITKLSLTSKYRAFHQTTKTIFLEEGIYGLWKGHIPGQLLSITYGFVQFQSFELLTLAAHKTLDVNYKSANVHFVCGCLAGTSATVVSFPFDVIRTRFIAQGNDRVYFSLANAFMMMLTKESPRSLFKGLTPTLISVAPQAGGIFMFHNILSSIANNSTVLSDNNLLTLPGNLLVGSLAGILGKTVVYPLDLSKKRLQIQGFAEGRKGFGENFTCRGMLDSLVLTFKKEGLVGLYKGLSPSILKAAVTTALHFTAYNEMCKLLFIINGRLV